MTSKLHSSNRKHLPLYILPCIILTALFLLYVVWLRVSTILQHDPSMAPLAASISLPTSIKGAAEIAENLQRIAEAHPYVIYGIFLLAYFLKHAFTIPGSSAMNVLAGAMFGTLIGTVTCTLLTGCGASFAYLLSYEFATPLIEKYPSLMHRLQTLRHRVDNEKLLGTLPFYLLSFRILPFGPQWAFNLLCPHALVPLSLFAWTTALGQLPYIILTVRGGALLATVPYDELFTLQNTFGLFLLALIVIIPVFFVRRYRQRQRVDSPKDETKENNEKEQKGHTNRTEYSI